MNDRTNPAEPHAPNPYDFANPVSRKDFFIGREKERKDIEYYLDHASRSERSINLALLGDRAAGKTSLLNMIELGATERGLIPVRIDLNESDIESSLVFWFKVFDAIINRVVTEATPSGEDLVLGGCAGRTYDAYLDMITIYTVPSEALFCPFVFPIQFAKAMSVGNSTARVSDNILKRDLAAMAGLVGKPIILLVDECNILSSQRSLLEMIRNTFMNLPGYMLVFTGTQDLFPLMDEVFSPIVRQFKRIEVAPFATLSETREAVLNPIRRIGRDDLVRTASEEVLLRVPNESRRFIDEDMTDIHELTGGRPYEIQLVCHFMYKRVQQGKDSRMRLSFDVLEDVLVELRQSHDVDSRPTISAVRSLDMTELSCLRVLLQSAGKAPVRQLAFATRVSTKASPELAHISTVYQKLQEARVLHDCDGRAVFCGDDFDRIVCKYAARQRGIAIAFEPASAGGILQNGILDAWGMLGASKNGSGEPDFSWFYPIFGSHDPVEEGYAASLDALWRTLPPDATACDLFKQCQDLVRELYRFLIGWEDQLAPALSIVRVEVAGQGVSWKAFYCILNDSERGGKKERAIEVLNQMQERARVHGGDLWSEVREFPISGFDEVYDIGMACADEDTVKVVASTHAAAMVRCYGRVSESKRALRHAEIARPFANILDDYDINNVGYVLLGNGRIDDAIAMFSDVLARNERHALARYNCALAHFQNGNSELSIDMFRQVIEHEKRGEFSGTGVVFVLENDNGKLTIQELWTKSFRETSERSTISLADAASRCVSLITQANG